MNLELEALSTVVNRSTGQEKFLLDLLEGTMEELIDLEQIMLDNFYGKCPDTLAECKEVLKLPTTYKLRNYRNDYKIMLGFLQYYVRKYDPETVKTSFSYKTYFKEQKLNVPLPLVKINDKYYWEGMEFDEDPTVTKEEDKNGSV